MNLATLTIEMAANVARLQADMAQARRTVDGAMGQIQRSAQMAQRALGAIGAGLSVAGIVASVNRIVDSLDRLNDAADVTGAAVDKIAGLERLARLNGANLDTVTTALVKLNQAINASDGADSKATLALKALGLEAEALKKLDPADALLEVSKALDQFAENGNKGRLYITLFGKSVREVAPLLNDLRTQQGDYAVAAQRAAAQAETFNKSISALTFTFETFLRNALTPVVSTLNDLFNGNQQADFERQLSRAMQRLGQLQAMGVDAADGRITKVRDEIAALTVELNKIRGPEKPAGDKASAPDLQVLADEAEARKKAADAAKKQAEAAAKLREDIAKDIADQRMLVDMVRAGNDVDEARLRIQLARKGLTGEEIEQSVSLKSALDGMAEAKKALADVEEQEIRRRQEILDYAVAQEQSVAAEVKSVEQQIQAQLQQNETLGMTGTALAMVEAARLNDAAAEAIRRAEVLASDPVTQAEASRLRELADRYRELADAKIDGAVKADDQERAKKAIESQIDAAKDLERVFSDIGKSLTDSLFRGFESGKSFARNLRDSVVNLFKTTLIRIPLQGVLTSITGAVGSLFSGGASASQGGFGGGFMSALSGGKTIIDALSGSFSTGLGSLATSLGNAGFNSGAAFVNGFSSALNGGSAASFSGASSAYNLGNFAGQAAPFLPGVISAFQGDFKTAAFQTAGAAIGYSIGGPIGGGIGSAIGSLISGLVGTSGGTPHRGGTYGATAAGGSLIGGMNLSGGKITDYGRLRPASLGQSAVGDALRPYVETFASSLSLLTQSTVKAAAGIGADGEDASQAFLRVMQANKQIFGPNAGEATLNLAKDLKKGVEQFITFLQGEGFVRAVANSSAPQYVKEAFAQFDISGKVGKSNIDPTAVQKVAESLGRLQLAADALGKSLGLTKAGLSSAMISAAGGADALTAGLSAYYQAVLTPQEKLNDLTDQTRKAFTDAGVALPGTIGDFRALVEGIDRSSEAGQKLFGKVITLTPAFVQLQQAMAQVNSEVEQLQQAFKDAQLANAVGYATNADDALARTAFVQNGGALAVPVGTAVSSSSTGDAASETRAMRQDLRDTQAQVAALLARVNKIFSRWDTDGLPATRTA